MARSVDLSDTVNGTNITARVASTQGAANGSETVTIASPGMQPFTLTVDQLAALQALIVTLVGKARTAVT